MGARAISQILLRTAVTVGVATLTLPAIAGAAPADAAARPGLAPAAWAAAYAGPQSYPGINAQWNVPITMSDGTVLMADVYRPADAANIAVADKNPAIINVTPYGKVFSMMVSTTLAAPHLLPTAVGIAHSFSLAGTPISGVDDFKAALSSGLLDAFSGVDQQLVKSGYTQIVVDARGTGFSQGVWQVLGEREQQDTLEVLDWAEHQPWSNGKLGMNGFSYSAIAQLQAAAQRPEGLDAIFPVSGGADIMRDVLSPGGGLGVTFLSAWLASVNSQKFVPNAESILTGTFDWKWLTDRISDPLVYIPQILQGIFLPDPAQMSPLTQQLLTDSSALRQSYESPLANITAPTMAVGGWNDLFTNTEWRTLEAMTSLPADQKKLIVGSGYHFTMGAGMGAPGSPPSIKVLQKAWFDKWLKGIDNGIDNYAPATVNSYGQGWVQEDSYPLAGLEYRRLYLSGQRSGTAPHAVQDGGLLGAADNSQTTWTVAPGLTTLCSRDAGQASVGFVAIFSGCTEDNRVAESNALSFTSPPVTAPTRISGPINVHLNTVTDATDGYFTVMVTDVAPDGKSTVVSSGQLTSSLRAIDPAKSRFAPNGDLIAPHYPLNLNARQPVTPGRPTMLDIGSQATDLLLQPGHRLRLDVFALNLPKSITWGPVTAETGLRPESVVLDPAAPSWVNVPSDRPLTP